MTTNLIAKHMNESEAKKIERALLLGAYFSTKDKELCETNLEELSRLCETFGLVVGGSIASPVKKLDAGLYLGTGKLDEILQIVQDKSIDILIFDDEISPNQQKNLEKFFKKPVIDRTELIIEVFAKRAQTKEARLQVELARVKYQMPRLKRLWTHLSRESAGGGGGGGAYLRGAGEKQIEIDRRLLKLQMDQLRREIKAVGLQRETQRSRRIKTGIPTFAIIGYTNAGKSTLLKALTHADVLVEDKLFATLDTTTRKFVLENKQEILLIDTVGFIRKLPHTLVAAFKSTLEEAACTDILLHLIDASSPSAEMQAEATHLVLKSLKAEERPMITIFNKVDACKDPMQLYKLKMKFPGSIQISALKEEGFDLLQKRMIQEIASLRKVVKLRIPQSEYAKVSELMREGRVIFSDYEENDILLEIEIPGHLEYRIKEYIV